MESDISQGPQAYRTIDSTPIQPPTVIGATLHKAADRQEADDSHLVG